jgi:hypothetical protein
MKMIRKNAKKEGKSVMTVIKRGCSIDNTANLYSCCRKTQRSGEMGSGDTLC